MGPGLVRELSKLPSNDAVLAQALGGRPVVLGVAGLERDPGRPAQPVRQAPLRTIGGDPSRFVPRFEATLRSVEEIDRVAKGHGLLNFEAERGVVRRMPLWPPPVTPCFRRSGSRSSASPPARRCSPCGSAPRASRAWASAAFSFPPSRTGACGSASREPIRRASSRPPTFSPERSISMLFERKLVLIGVTALGPVRLPGDARDRADVGRGDPRPAPRDRSSTAISCPGPAPRRGRRPPCCSWAVSDSCWWCRDWRSGPRSGRSRSWSASTWAGGFLAYLHRGLLFDAALPSLALGALFTAMLVVTLAEAESQRQILRRSIEQQREQAARLAGELEAARRIQMSSLPQPTTVFPGDTRLDLYAFLEPAPRGGRRSLRLLRARSRPASSS